jgi:hypothetical protein
MSVMLASSASRKALLSVIERGKERTVQRQALKFGTEALSVGDGDGVVGRPGGVQMGWFGHDRGQ